jgi:hypothetical protein
VHDKQYKPWAESTDSFVLLQVRSPICTFSKCLGQRGFPSGHPGGKFPDPRPGNFPKDWRRTAPTAPGAIVNRNRDQQNPSLWGRGVGLAKRGQKAPVKTKHVKRSLNAIAAFLIRFGAYFRGIRGVQIFPISLLFLRIKLERFFACSLEKMTHKMTHTIWFLVGCYMFIYFSIQQFSWIFVCFGA